MQILSALDNILLEERIFPLPFTSHYTLSCASTSRMNNLTVQCQYKRQVPISISAYIIIFFRSRRKYSLEEKVRKSSSMNAYCFKPTLSSIILYFYSRRTYVLLWHAFFLIIIMQYQRKKSFPLWQKIYLVNITCLCIQRERHRKNRKMKGAIKFSQKST